MDLTPKSYLSQAVSTCHKQLFKEIKGRALPRFQFAIAMQDRDAISLSVGPAVVVKERCSAVRVAALHTSKTKN